MIWSWLRRHPVLVDVGLVVALLAANTGEATHRGESATGIPLAVVATLPLLVRRRRPIAVLAWTAAATIAIAAVEGRLVALSLGLALYTVAAHCERRRALAAGGVTLLAMVWPALHDTGYDAGKTAASLVIVVVPWLIGDSLRSRRAYTAGLEEKAERLERERETEARRAVAEEQARIARELHDVIAHSVSVMVVQAAAARDVFDKEPQRAREALAAIESTGREALAELRRVLGVVRAEYAPQPGLARLDALVEQVRAAGLDVRVSVEGEPRPLPAGVDLSAYRVVQEALTNTLKHASASRADVAVRFDADALALAVRDDGVGPNGDRAGHGLIGMRERVALYGGELETGAAPGGGFAVSARFPLEPS